MSSEQIGIFRRLFDLDGCCCRTVFPAAFGFMTALLTLHFLDELFVGFRGELLPLGRTSAGGAELHDTDVPLPLSDELFVVCRFGRFLLLRLEDATLRVLALERRFGFTSSFPRRLDVFREE